MPRSPLNSTLGIVMIQRFLSIAIFSVVSAGSIAADKTANLSTISTLHRAQPSVRWIEKSLVVADVTCDEKPDRIAIGYGEDKSVWIGFVQSGGRAKTIRFSLGRHRQDSFCSTPVRLETSSLTCTDEEMGDLPGCREVTGCSAFSAIDDSCDSFHFYWNASRKELVWWRR